MSQPVVWIIDDDAALLQALARLLSGEGYTAQTHLTAASFLAAHDPALPGCALVDLGLPDLDGLSLQARLRETGRPILFLSGAASVPQSVRAMRAGAVDFLTKPVEATILISAVREAIAVDHRDRARSAATTEIRHRLATLTPREREVLDEVAAGRLNKQIADRLGAAEKTVKVHRGRVMRKMGVRSVADLVRLLDRIAPP